GTLYRTIRLDYMVRDCIALRDNKIAVIGEELLDGSGKWKQHVSIIDIKTEKEVKVINFFEEKKNMFISVQNDKHQMTLRNPFRDFNTCINRTKAGDLIVGYPENREIHIFSLDGEEIGLIELDYSSIPITQTEKDDHYNELIAFNSERKIEINADELKVIKSNEYFPEHWPYYYDIKVDTDDNILVFKYTKDKDQTFRVYQVYSKDGNFICETTIDSAGYQGPNIGRMKFFKGDLYGLLSQKYGKKEDALVKIGLTGRSGAVETQSRQSADLSGRWTRVSGGSTLNQPAKYGTRGVAAGTNNPGARCGSVSWTDSKGNLWLFGGQASRNRDMLLNDLWKFDGADWIWVSGDDEANRPASYGTKGVVSSTNNPGGRYGSVSWADSKGNLWLFGGYGYGQKRLKKGYLNDLWKFDGTNWTWVSGDNLLDRSGVQETKSVTAPASKPGSRSYSVSWIDSKDNLWLFGGSGYAGTGFLGYLNDLWKFDGTNWTWVSGDFRTDQEGIYGEIGVSENNSVPGARQGSVSWTDSKDNLWLFGGVGADRYRIGGDMNDLWKFDGANWTWVSGESTANNWRGVYGIMGVPDKSNRPKARSGGMSWIDRKDNLWLFGGVSSNLIMGRKPLLNDLWKFDGVNWTWVSGDNPEDKFKDENLSDAKHPDARFDSVSWIDNEGSMWLFGGRRIRNDLLNDLWRLKP
ncbi:Kelch repeat-containing protein, partial [Thermodesulfobacteriota bacterium]